MSLSPKAMTTALQTSIETGDASVAFRVLDQSRYKQHNPSLADGVAGVAEVHALLPHDKTSVNVVRAFEDGDFGFVHVDYHLFGPTVAFDVHRFEGGVSVEHWDNLQETPIGRNKSGRTMTDGKTQAKDRDTTVANKALVERFTQQVLVDGQVTKVGEFFDGDDLVQHNPHMGDGVAELLAVRAGWEQQGGPARYDRIHMVLGEGNFVLVLSEGSFLNRHTAFYDLYRVETDRIAEHWDVVEAIPPEQERKNANGKF